MSGNSEAKKVLVEIIYPNDLRRVLLVPSVGGDALRVALKDIERSRHFNERGLWNWPAETQTDAKSLFALSTAQSQDVRNECIVQDEESLLEKRTFSSYQDFNEGDEPVMQLFLIVKFYPQNPFKFSPFVASFILQQLTCDIVNYDYLFTIQYETEEQKLEQYLINNYDVIMSLDEMCEQAYELLADISKHPFYGFQYFPVFQKDENGRYDFLIGVGMRGFLFCQNLRQDQKCSLPVPFLVRFDEVDELTFLPANESDSFITMFLKRGNASKKKRMFLNFLSKERLHRFIELMEGINEINDKFPSSYSHRDPSLEYIPARTVRVVTPKKAKGCFSPGC